MPVNITTGTFQLPHAACYSHVYLNEPLPGINGADEAETAPGFV